MEPLPVLVVSSDPLARGGLAALVAAARRELSLAGPGDAGRGRRRVRRARPPRSCCGISAAAAPSSSGPRRRRWWRWSSTSARRPTALRSGARGALLRGADAESIAAALLAAARGLTVLDGDLAGDLIRLPAAAPSEPLTPREREALALLAEGLSNKAIAARLGVSEHTAKFHVNAILGKLGVESRAEAIVQAARMGLVVL